jgi:hypothetical protein
MGATDEEILVLRGVPARSIEPFDMRLDLEHDILVCSDLHSSSTIWGKFQGRRWRMAVRGRFEITAPSSHLRTARWC